jgi:hypothetical protein
VFDSQKTQFAALAADEAATVKASIAALRDLQLITLLRGDPTAVGDLRKRLDQLTGGLDPSHLQTLDKVISQKRTQLDQNNFRLEDARKQFKKAGFTDDVSNCADLGAAPAVPNLTADLHTSLLDQIRTACADVTGRQQTTEQDIAKAYRTGSSKLGQTVSDLETYRKELQDQTDKAAALKKTLASLKKQVDDAKDSATADFAKSALNFCAADPSSATSAKAASAPATLQAAFKECSVAAAVGVDPLVKSVKHAYLASEIQSVISSILSADASSASGQPPGPDVKIATSTVTALKTLDLLTGAADEISANGQPSVNALLVGLAYEQHQVAINDLAAQTLKQRIALSIQKREAQVSEIAHLARAIVLARAPASGAVLSEVNAAWKVGRYRAELVNYAEINVIRQDPLLRGREVTTSWKNLLQPALDELVAYGKGGLDQQTVATLILAAVNAGGFSAVAAKGESERTASQATSRNATKS